MSHLAVLGIVMVAAYKTHKCPLCNLENPKWKIQDIRVWHVSSIVVCIWNWQWYSLHKQLGIWRIRFKPLSSRFWLTTLLCSSWMHAEYPLINCFVFCADNQLVQYVPADDFGTLFDLDLNNGPSFGLDLGKTTEESTTVTTPTIDVTSPLAQRRKNKNLVWSTEEIDWTAKNWARLWWNGHAICPNSLL